MVMSRPLDPPSTTLESPMPNATSHLSSDELGALHDGLRSLLELETQRVAAIEADGLPPLAARDLIEMADTISAALAKIDAGTYGICERCAAPIPFARLEAVPYAAYCVTCQAKGPSLLG